MTKNYSLRSKLLDLKERDRKLPVSHKVRFSYVHPVFRIDTKRMSGRAEGGRVLNTDSEPDFKDFAHYRSAKRDVFHTL